MEHIDKSLHACTRKYRVVSATGAVLCENLAISLVNGDGRFFAPTPSPIEFHLFDAYRGAQVYVHPLRGEKPAVFEHVGEIHSITPIGIYGQFILTHLLDAVDLSCPFQTLPIGNIWHTRCRILYYSGRAIPMLQSGAIEVPDANSLRFHCRPNLPPEEDPSYRCLIGAVILQDRRIAGVVASIINAESGLLSCVSAEALVSNCIADLGGDIEIGSLDLKQM